MKTQRQSCVCTSASNPAPPPRCGRRLAEVGSRNVDIKASAVKCVHIGKQFCWRAQLSRRRTLLQPQRLTCCVNSLCAEGRLATWLRRVTCNECLQGSCVLAAQIRVWGAPSGSAGSTCSTSSTSSSRRSASKRAPARCDAPAAASCIHRIG